MINSLAELQEAILEGAARGLGLGAEVVASLARSKAPVRKIFAESGRTIHVKSIEGREPERFVRTAGLPPTTASAPVPTKTPVHWRERRLAAAQRLLQEYEAKAVRELRLSRRGAYEVRTKRAQFTTWEHAAIGGRLRGSIEAQPVVKTAAGAEAWVIASAPYARYQEFGTRHNRAQPFLRPAAEESRGEVVRLIADAVRAASRTGAGSAQIEIVVRI